MKIKKLVCAILMCCMVAGLLSLSAYAADEAASGTCGNNLTWVLDSDGVLTISGEGEMTSYSSASSVPWYSYASDITAVSLSDGLTSIGAYAFERCTGITKITIPDSVTSIGNGAFYGCNNLEEITLSNNITEISRSMFLGCSSLSHIEIPYGATKIGVGAFWGCTGLTSVTIPSSVTSIGAYAFLSCNNLTEVHISDVAAWCGITFEKDSDYTCNPLYLGADLYLDGELISDLVIPDGVEKISAYAFVGYQSLNTVTVPSSVISVGEYAF